MIQIQYQDVLDKENAKLIDEVFEELALQNHLVCDSTSFCFVACDEGKVVGVLTGRSYYKEVHIRDLAVIPSARHQHVGTSLMIAVEDYFRKKGFEQINLTTYQFQTPEFYKKCGYVVEFQRVDKQNPLLTKYFLIKYLRES